MGKAKTRPRDDRRPSRRDERPGHRGADARTRTGNLPITWFGLLTTASECPTPLATLGDAALAVLTAP